MNIDSHTERRNGGPSLKYCVTATTLFFVGCILLMVAFSGCKSAPVVPPECPECPMAQYECKATGDSDADFAKGTSLIASSCEKVCSDPANSSSYVNMSGIKKGFYLGCDCASESPSVRVEVTPNAQ